MWIINPNNTHSAITSDIAEPTSARVWLIHILVLAWIGSTQAGEIHDAVKNGEVEKIKVLMSTRNLLPIDENSARGRYGPGWQGSERRPAKPFASSRKKPAISRKRIPLRPSSPRSPPRPNNPPRRCSSPTCSRHRSLRRPTIPPSPSAPKLGMPI